MGALAKIAAEASRPECSVVLCTAGALNARHQELERQLVAEARKDRTSLADGGRRREIAEQMQSVGEQMRAHEHTFTFRGMSRRDWSDLTAKHPPRAGVNERLNVDTFLPAVILACLVEVDGEPADATEDEVDALLDVLNEGQRDALFGAAWTANTGGVSVPFSDLSSEILQSTGQK